MVSAILRIVQAIWLSILGCCALWAQAAISGSVVALRMIAGGE